MGRIWLREAYANIFQRGIIQKIYDSLESLVSHLVTTGCNINNYYRITASITNHKATD